MDTRFWGPSGWALLHLIAADPTVATRKRAVARWFELLPFVLPCKYCRASLSDYYQLQPLTEEALATPETFSRWLYEIHNRVNNKLRGQGLLTMANPAWTTIRDRYAKQQAELCNSSPFLGWDFMTSVAFTTPAVNYKPVPMPDTPEESKATLANLDMRSRNRYNLLTREERVAALQEWWSLIPSILPCPAWRSFWSAATRTQIPLKRGREPAMEWIWDVEDRVCQDLRCPPPHESLPFLKRTMKVYESSCGKTQSRRAKTCRRKKRLAKAKRLVRASRKREAAL
jgi:hypothetical protein